MKTKIATCTIMLLLLLVLVNDALAMSSTNYALNWLVPFNGSGGSPMSSTNYKMDATIGQTAIGTSTSTNYGVGLGYWYGMIGSSTYLPLIMK